MLQPVRTFILTAQRARYATCARFVRIQLTQSLAREFGEKNVHVAHIIVDGLIESKTALEFFKLPTNERFTDGNVRNTCGTDTGARARPDGQDMALSGTAASKHLDGRTRPAAGQGEVLIHTNTS